jgi:hypothetical protein
MTGNTEPQSAERSKEVMKTIFDLIKNDELRIEAHRLNIMFPQISGSLVASHDKKIKNENKRNCK